MSVYLKCNFLHFLIINNLGLNPEYVKKRLDTVRIQRYCRNTSRNKDCDTKAPCINIEYKKILYDVNNFDNEWRYLFERHVDCCGISVGSHVLVP